MRLIVGGLGRRRCSGSLGLALRRGPLGADPLGLGDGDTFGRQGPAPGAQPVQEATDHAGPDRHRADAAEVLHPPGEADVALHLRVRRQAVVVEHLPAWDDVHHVQPADTARVVEHRLLEPASLQLGDLRLAVRGHLLLRAEADRARRASLDAGRLHAVGDAVRAHRALVDLLRARVEAGDVERAAGDAVLAADALRLVEVDDPVLVLHDRARSGAGEQAAGLVAVHAAVLADQPGEVTVVEVDLGEAHQVPRVGREILVALVAAEVVRLLGLEVVPLLARHLARLAADAEVDVDELGHLVRRPGAARARRRGGRLAPHLQFGDRGWHQIASYALSTLTRKPLYSGVRTLASPMYGVSKLAIVGRSALSLLPPA